MASKSRIPKIDQEAFMEKFSKQAVKDNTAPITDILDRNDLNTEGFEFIDIDLMDDAPSSLNDYPRLKDTQPEKYIELKLSIYEYGVLQSLLLMRKPDGRFMILGGHNRRDICKDIISECKDQSTFEISKYKLLRSTVIEKVDDKTARNLIDDVNLAQRDYASLTKEQKARIIVRRMQNLKEKRYSQGEGIEQLVRELGVKKSTIYDNLLIATKVIEQIHELYFKDILSHDAVLKYSSFSRDTQQWIFDTYGDKINTATSLLLNKHMSEEQIKAVFEADNKKMKRISFLMPENLSDEFREIVNEQIKAVTKANSEKVKILSFLIPEDRSDEIQKIVKEALENK